MSETRKATFQVTDMRWYLILVREMTQQIGYIHFPKITLTKLAEQAKKHTHLDTIKMKSSSHKAANKKSQDLKQPKIYLLNGTVLISGKRHRLPITKEYILEEYHNVFSGLGTLCGKEYHLH